MLNIKILLASYLVVEFVYGKLVGDKGYISKNLFERLLVDGIQLITKLNVAFPKKRVSMFHERLTHSLLCSVFVDLTLTYSYIILNSYQIHV